MSFLPQGKYVIEWYPEMRLEISGFDEILTNDWYLQ